MHNYILTIGKEQESWLTVSIRVARKQYYNNTIVGDNTC